MRDKLKDKLKYLVFLVALLPLFINSSFWTTLLISIAIYAIYAISYDLLMGYTGIVSMGHAMFFGLGAYIVAYVTVRLKLPFVTGAALAIFACIVLGLIISLITVRVKSIYFNMVTMAIGQLLFVLAMKMTSITGGDDGLPGVRSIFPNKTVFCCVAIALMLLVYFFARRMVNSSTGRVLQAVRGNEDRMGLLGYNVFKYKMLVIEISGVLAGIAGMLYVMLVGIAYPSLLSTSITLQGLFMVVLGGVGTLNGAIIGAAALRLMDTVLSQYTNRWSLIMGIVFVVMILFFPQGIMGIYHTAKNKFSRKGKNKIGKGEKL